VAASDLIIIGASARAAAFSALRAGIEPWCADLFGDRDLRSRAPVSAVSPSEYPEAFFRLFEKAPFCPWMYTGALENRPRLLQKLAKLRPLWGNDAATVAAARQPVRRTMLLRQAGLPCPDVRTSNQPPAAGGGWLQKPIASAGGHGIRAWSREPARRGWYFQEYVVGVPCSAVYIGMHGQARLLGATRQLIGENWLYAGPFRYCGSIGPLALSVRVQATLAALGGLIVHECGLRGVFGVDYVLRDDQPCCVEVNPRYTGSVEILEHALGIRAVALHASAFGWEEEQALAAVPSVPPVAGKAIIFARGDMTFPQDGPWLPALNVPRTDHAMTAFADIPMPGTVITRGRPILTVLAAGASEEDCGRLLRERVRDLDRWLYER